MSELAELDEETRKNLEHIADHRSDPFCYNCYRVCPTGRCPVCGSDDLMRHLEGVGVEYGYEWVIEHLLKTELNGMDEEEQDEIFADYVDSDYGDKDGQIKIGWITVNVSTAIKELDPVFWGMGLDEYFDDPDQYLELDGKTYRIDDLEDWIEGQLEAIPDRGSREIP